MKCSAGRATYDDDAQIDPYAADDATCDEPVCATYGPSITYVSAYDACGVDGGTSDDSDDGGCFAVCDASCSQPSCAGRGHDGETTRGDAWPA
jgi:hypothetical protein